MGQEKVKSISKLKEQLEIFRKQGKKIVFTNGCFDLIHLGHIRYLRKAKKLGDILVVGLNSDSSVRRIKGKKRPIVPEKDRAEILASFEFVDYVVLFKENTPRRLIEEIKPDVLVKGGDWRPDEIVGADFVLASGGKLKVIPFLKGRSSSKIIKTILARYSEGD